MNDYSLSLNTCTKPRRWFSAGSCAMIIKFSGVNNLCMGIVTPKYEVLKPRGHGYRRIGFWLSNN